MRYFEENGTLVICLEGRITSDNAAETEKEKALLQGFRERKKEKAPLYGAFRNAEDGT